MGFILLFVKKNHEWLVEVPLWKTDKIIIHLDFKFLVGFFIAGLASFLLFCLCCCSHLGLTLVIWMNQKIIHFLYVFQPYVSTILFPCLQQISFILVTSFFLLISWANVLSVLNIFSKNQLFHSLVLWVVFCVSFSLISVFILNISCLIWIWISPFLFFQILVLYQ